MAKKRKKIAIDKRVIDRIDKRQKSRGQTTNLVTDWAKSKKPPKKPKIK